MTTMPSNPPPQRQPAVRAIVALTVTAMLAAAVALLVSATIYPWMRALHIIAVIAWMAGMLYLPRLFVYHCDAEKGSKQSETFKVMERRLLHAIINPAMVAVWVIGIWLAWSGKWYAAPWFQVKVVAVLALSGVHGYLSASVRAFAEDRNTKSATHWRVINEVPTVLMIIIVVLAVVKPW